MSEDDKTEEAPQQTDAPDVSGKTIIVIDDDPSSLELMKGLLEKTGFAVRTAASGKAGLEAAEMTTPDVFICDVIMPEMDGLEFFKSIQNNEKFSKVPIMIVSARKNMQESFLALGVDVFLAKPIDAEDFLKQVTVLSLKSPAPAPQDPPPAEG